MSLLLNGSVNGIPHSKPYNYSTLLSRFIESYNELQSYKYVDNPVACLSLSTLIRSGKAVKVDGRTLSVAAVTAAARYHASVELDDCPTARARLAKSRKVITDKVESGTSVYGLSTGFGGSGGLPKSEFLIHS